MACALNRQLVKVSSQSGNSTSCQKQKVLNLNFKTATLILHCCILTGVYAISTNVSSIFVCTVRCAERCAGVTELISVKYLKGCCRVKVSVYSVNKVE